MKSNPYFGMIIALTIGAFNGVLLKLLELEPEVITFFRLAVPAFVLFFFIKFYKKKKILRGNFKLMLVASAFNASRMFLYFLAFSYTSVANGIIMLYTWPIFSSIFGVIFIKEKAKLKEWLLISLAFFGVIVIMSNQELSFSNTDLVGMLIMIASAALFAVTVVIFKKKLDEYSPTETIFYQSILGAVIFFPFIFFSNEGLTLGKSLLAIGHYGFLVGILGFVLLFRALKKLKVIQYSLIGYWEVIAGVLFGIVLLGDDITLNMVFGGLMIISAGWGLVIYKQNN
ncbi:DMT family transporter [Patescibacteria group bacterium]|nr:DMT family transporter [Patescibacteria group bacterium]